MNHSAALYEALCARIASGLSPDMHVLELACGTGQLSFPLAHLVQCWEATDFSEAMIEEARKLPAPEQLHFSVGDATALPYADDSYDAVVIANALHIMPHPELALAEIRRVLKPDGILFAPTFLRPASLFGRIRIQVIKLAGFHTFYQWNELDYLSFLQAHGFAVTDHSVLGGGLLPLCAAEAIPIEAAPEP